MKKYIVYESEASRWELIIRIVYKIFIQCMLSFYSITASICFVLQWLGILFLGRRSESLTNALIGFSEFVIQIIPYTFLLTDERPGIMPKELKFFVNNKEYLTFEDDASRLELIVRIFYSIPICIIAYLFSILTSIVLVLQWIYILFIGRRNESLNNFIQSFVKYVIQVISYLSLVTDERPDIFPGDIEVSSETGSEIGTVALGEVIKTSPPLSRSIKDKHIGIGIILSILSYVILFMMYMLMLMWMLSNFTY